MTRVYRTLTAVTSTETAAQPPEAVINVESDFVVILAALLCALICTVGLIAVARCACLRRGSVGAAGSGRSSNQPSVNKGLKKKFVEAIPKYSYDGKLGGDCSICLAEYVTGDMIRVLPQCSHRFHVGCIDLWLGSHSSCPSCRQILAATRCKKCGEFVSCLAGEVKMEVGDGKERRQDTGTGSTAYLP